MSAAANSPCPTALRAAGSFSRRRWLVGLLLASIINSPAGPVDGITETPLAPRSGSHGATLFTELPPAQTGVVATNDYSDPKMWWELNHEFENGAIGTGVAIGDYDGDGRPDIFVVSKTESCRLFRNLGNYHFEDVTEKAGVGDKGSAAGIWKQGVTFADVTTTDCWTSTCAGSTPRTCSTSNQGDGTFKESAHAYGLDVNDASVMAAFCD